MASATFDTLPYSKRLQELGFTREQSEGFAQIQRELIDDRLATKQDLLAVKIELQQQMKDLEYRLTIHLGGMMAASIAIAAALVKLTLRVGDNLSPTEGGPVSPFLLPQDARKPRLRHQQGNGQKRGLQGNVERL